MSRRSYGHQRLNNNNEKQFNEISDEAQHEISMAIHASARQSIRPYNSQDEYLFAMKEDLSEWLAILHSESINEYSFFRKLETGILLCKHANTVTLHAEEFIITNPHHPVLNRLKVPQKQVRFNEGRHVKAESFFARDNVAQFINWCRSELGISDTIMFETEDLVLRKNEKNFILTLLEVARRGAKFGMEAPTIIKMEQEIEREMMIDAGESVSSEDDHIYEPEVHRQKVAADFKSLDEMVQYFLGQCSCPTMFSLRKVGDGKYQIGDSKALIYMRILRNHVMVRVGGGWDTLENYLNKHDPCRCNRHRAERHLKSKYGASHLRLNQTMSPIPRRLRPEPQNHTPNRSKSALSSSLSRSTPHLAQTLPARGSVSSSPSPNRRSTTRTIQRPDNSDLDYRGPSRRSTPGGLKSAKSTSNLSRLSSSESSRKPYDSTRRRLKLKQSNDNLTVERKKSGHVITNRLSVSPSVRPASSSGSTSMDVMSKTLPSSFTHRRSRPLKDDSNERTSTPKRSQTPSRYSQRPSSAASNHSMSSSFSNTPTQSRYQSSTPKSRTSTRSTPKSNGPATRTRRLTSNESTSKFTQSRESSVERVLEDKRTRSRSYEPKSSQIQLKIQRNQIEQCDGELTLDDLETKFSIDDIDVNPIVNPSEINNLSLSLNSKRIPRKTTVKPRQELRPGSSRSRIPVPVPSRSTTSRAQSPDFNPNYSPERADSGIDIYTEFETSPTNSIRRNGQNVRHNQRPPDIPEQS